MEIIQKTARMNREGVNLLAAGKEREALKAFTQGLQMITGLASQVDIDQLRMMQLAEQQQQQQQQQQQLQEANNQMTVTEEQKQEQQQQQQHPPSTPNTNTTQGKSNCCCSEGNHHHHHGGNVGGVFVTDVLIDGLHDEEFYIHNKAFLFFPPTISPYENLTFYSAIFLFNMALCYHRRYMTTQQDIMEDMAGQLYDGCCQTMQEYCQNAAANATAVNANANANATSAYTNTHVFLWINALNNQGQLLFVNADRRYTHVTNTMTQIIRKSKRVQEIHSQILLNILMCSTLKSAGTAAA